MNKVLLTITGLFTLIVVSSGSGVAQAKNETRTIIINNGDTIINGKSLSKVDKEERKELMDEFKDLEKRMKVKRLDEQEIRVHGGKDADVVIRSRKEPHVLFWDENENGELRFETSPRSRVYTFKGDSLTFNLRSDSLFKRFNFRMPHPDSLMKEVEVFGYDFAPRLREFSDRQGGVFTPHQQKNFYFPQLGQRKNSSQFSYNYVDKDGIPERINISISDAQPEQFKKISSTNDSENTLLVQDLTIFPAPSSGSLNLSFSINSSGSTKVRVLDSSLNELSSETTLLVNETYLKPINIVRNGVYYIAVSQNGKWYVKRVVKE